jgi:hypothetical protein
MFNSTPSVIVLHQIKFHKKVQRPSLMNLPVEYTGLMVMLRPLKSVTSSVIPRCFVVANVRVSVDD